MPSPFELGFIALEHRDNSPFPVAASLKEALALGGQLRKDELNRKLRERQSLNELARTIPSEANREFINTLKGDLKKSIQELKEISFIEANKEQREQQNSKHKNFLEIITRIHNLGFLEIIPDSGSNLKMENSSSTKDPFIRGELKLSHLIDPSYSNKVHHRPKLYFMIMNEKHDLKTNPKTELRIYSDDSNPESPFYHLNIEFDKKNLNEQIKNIFRSRTNHGTQTQKLANSSNQFLELEQEHEKIHKLLDAENKIIEYLTLRQLGKAPSSIDNLNLLKSLNQIIDTSKSSLISRSQEIQSGESFTGKPFYLDKLYNMTKESLILKEGYINTDSTRIQFLMTLSPNSEQLPLINLKVTDKLKNYSKSFLLDPNLDRNLKQNYQQELDQLNKSTQNQNRWTNKALF